MIAPSGPSGQLPLAELPKRLWDCLVIGAGPAGCAAAIHLAGRGRSVLLLDRARYPREKACGEGLISDSLAALRRLGLEEEIREAGHPAPGLSVFSPSRIRVDAPGEYLTLRRSRFDALLARRAVSQGAVFGLGEVGSLRVEADGAVVAGLRSSGGGATVRSRTAVLATGARLQLASSLGMVPPEHARPDAVAVRCRVASSVRVERLVASFDRSVLPGYAWIFPLGEGEYNIGCGVFRDARRGVSPNLAATLAHFVRQFPPAEEVWRNGRQTTPLEGAPLRCGFRGARALGPGNVLAAGETIGATFPFTGEGIGKALETGELAAQVIDAALASGKAGELRTYEERLAREVRPKYLGYEIAERWLSRPWVIDFLARRVQKSRHLARAALGILRETADPREIFSVAGVLRSLLPLPDPPSDSSGRRG